MDYLMRTAWMFAGLAGTLIAAPIAAQSTIGKPGPTTLTAAPHTSAVAQHVEAKPLEPGEYITDAGWGRLLLTKDNGALRFSVESTTGQSMCSLQGKVRGTQGNAEDETGATGCKVRLSPVAEGIDVATPTPMECKTLCGYNGGFEARYLRVTTGCDRNAVTHTRAVFQQHYDRKDYQAALTALSPILTQCGQTLEWDEKGDMRNDLAITQYKTSQYTQCLETLHDYAEDAASPDDAVTDNWPPALADRYLAIVRAARTNIGLCKKGLARQKKG
ncbi:hypothetical protein FHY16_000713 [Xanthomonas campestris]|uniref:hypothetical protein n=1 Tax=Xanthomonas euroxanthea TaxID=2259622 RepID=UPI0017E1B328|nr:hypothetical protein [Xanthomonas euroxanthea]MBB3777992.1 hypothetical protein [Xanthomonas euroxanthea]